MFSKYDISKSNAGGNTDSIPAGLKTGSTEPTSGSCLAHLLGVKAVNDASAPDMVGENGDPCYSNLGFRDKHSEQLASDLLGLKQQLVGNDPEMIAKVISSDWPKVVAGLSSMSQSDRQSHIVLLFKLCFFARAIRGQGNRSRVQFYLLFDKLREQFPSETLSVVNHIPHFGCFQDLDHLVNVYTAKRDEEMVTCLLDIYCKYLFADISRLLHMGLITESVNNPKMFDSLFNSMQGMSKNLRTMTVPKLREFIRTLPEGDFSLAGKWLKREGKKNSRHRDDLIRRMFPLIPRDNTSFMNKGRQLLRYIGSALSQCLYVTEQFMTNTTSRGWGDINLRHVPSRATTVYRKALLNKDKKGNERSTREDRRQCAQNTLKAILEGKLNGAQSDLKALADLIWEKMGGEYGSMSSIMSKGERDLINAQWKKMVEFTNQLIEDTLERDRVLREEAVKAGDTPPEPVRDPRAVLPIADVSGSMSSVRVMHYAIAMAIVCASISTIPGKLITFSETPEVFAFDPNADIFDLFRQIKQCNWGMNTNLDATHKLLLSEMVKARASGASISTDFASVIFTDGDFDNMVCWGTGGRSYGTPRQRVTLAEFDTYQTRLEKSFTDEGFSVPMMVYWNMAVKEGGFPAQSSTTGVKLVAGFSQTIMVEVMTGDYKTVVDEKTGAVKVSVTPLESFIKTMSDPYYNIVEETLRTHWPKFSSPPRRRSRQPSIVNPPLAPKKKFGETNVFSDINQDQTIADLEARLVYVKNKRINELKAEIERLVCTDS